MYQEALHNLYYNPHAFGPCLPGLIARVTSSHTNTSRGLDAPQPLLLSRLPVVSLWRACSLCLQLGLRWLPWCRCWQWAQSS